MKAVWEHALIEPLCDNHVIGTARSANSKRSLTPSLDLGKEGLGMNPTRVCSVEGCNREHSARGWCTRHYQRVRKYGTPGSPDIKPRDGTERAAAGVATDTHCACGRPRAYKKYRQCHPCRERDRRRNPVGVIPEPDRFFARVERGEPLECWKWTGSQSEQGYGLFRVDGGRTVPAHRWSFEFFRDAIPAGLVIDHLCRTPHCVNPWHLDPVTIKVNSLRGEAPGVVAYRTDTCKRGHSLVDAYVRKDTGHRMCRACGRERWSKKAADPQFRANRAAKARARRAA